ncbi:hypothetical protein GCM10022197_19980 [Microlunatus spumicola]|uniref:DUF3592 domain-containing protein n=1 Tax=Microlunatus spumicola TaxID=81499 RepID=A0ABP6XBS3_9ACTN
MRTPRAARRDRDELLKPYRVAAVVLLVLGVLCVLVELQSPSLVYWTGERVPATNDAGIVYYEVHGEPRTLNDPREAPVRPAPTAVYADPDDASRDRQAGPGRWFDAAFVLAPFVAAGALPVLGLVRRRRFRERLARRATAGSDGPPPSRPSPSPRSSR